MDYKKKIDQMIENAEKQFLTDSYGSGLEDLIRKMKNFKDFLQNAKSIELDYQKEDEEKISEYYHQKLEATLKRFFNS